jgi:hypothetical protein
MTTIGTDIHWKMPWVPLEQPINLVMYNGSGNGTREAVGQ